ncbi:MULTISPECIES: hypothetical protein [unclassified Caulobacter]|uniref:hypothetical protein n=1 Tax=unclassified Caulobacter TaxID=2648921 RepID=UPI0006F32E30|nr:MULTISPECIES: hypothetical protein [unclassified Caulobacter]KQV57381.1 hypothetical protein ASC62_14085 [Caulobacter sp. Root342]KQV66953.1 hypothetical protein ASC70_14185 [Caulobacter sp. Root343]
MRFDIPADLDGLAGYIEPFMALAGRARWVKRLDILAIEKDRSPYRWKIVADYHWLEMAVGFQAEVLAREGRLRPEFVDGLIFTSLRFAATTVEVHRRLSSGAQSIMTGRLRDALKAENGFAAIYLELDLAQRIMDSGGDVTFTDFEGTHPFDYRFKQGDFVGEVECKSLSADAGRNIHRKDFYRFIDALEPTLVDQRSLDRKDILLITLDHRLSPATSDQERLRLAAAEVLSADGPDQIDGSGFTVQRQPFERALGTTPISNENELYDACTNVFGRSLHLSGGLTATGGCVVVMRSLREDDPSKPMLDALRKAADQFTRTRPGFIAVQDHGIEPADLMLPHLRRRAGILAYALFGHYGGDHVASVTVSAFGAVVSAAGGVGTPSFSIPNPTPAYPATASDAPVFLEPLSDQEFANRIGTPLPASNISDLPI